MKVKKIKAKDFLKFLISCVGVVGYWYGTIGQTATPELLESVSKRIPSMYTPSYIKRCKKWMGKTVTDCIGLFKMILFKVNKTNYIQSWDISATTTAEKCNAKPIENMNDIPVCGFVFKKGHVGYYIGDGKVIENKGVDYGVIISDFKMGKWLTWGKHPLIIYPKPKPKNDLKRMVIKIVKRLLKKYKK